MIEDYKATRRILRSLKPNDIDKPKVNSMISSTSYVIDWLETGIRPGSTRGIERRAGYEREIPCSHVLDSRKWSEKRVIVQDWSMARLRIEIALERLSEREREAYTLVHGENCSLHEAAVLMGIKKGAVQTYLNRAEEKLKSITYVQEALIL